MNILNPFELPQHLQPHLKKAKKLEWITIVYLCTVIVIMYLVMGSSQAMKTAWLEDALSTIPAIAFLIASKIFDKKKNKKFPYGYHRVFTIAFLTGSVALFSMGCYLAANAIISLASMDHPTIGSIHLWDHHIWMGWIMILALCYSAFPAMILGYIKLPIAKKLHNKILFTDADTQKADYMTAFTAMLGIVGVGFGFWWADASAALLISFSVIHDGYKNLSNSIQDLMDRSPQLIDKDEPDPLLKEMEEFIYSWDWVDKVDMRMREHGQIYFGEIYIIPNDNSNLIQNVEEGIKKLQKFHWKIFDIVIVPVTDIRQDSNIY